MLLDGQFDAMPVLNGVPLNAVEFQQAINNNYVKLQIITNSGLNKDFYTAWIYPYLYYFDVKFDNREGVAESQLKNEGKSNLILVPKGAKNPTVFQIKRPINNAIYSNVLEDFYHKP